MRMELAGAALAAVLLCACPPYARADDFLEEAARRKDDKAPSKDKVRWLGSPFNYQLESEVAYSAGLDTSLGNGTRGPVREYYSGVKAAGGARILRAFLLQSGIQWERYAFPTLGPNLIPDQLAILGAPTSLDFRFSRRDMLRVQTTPGLYWDMHGTGSDDFHVPVDYAYVHVFGKDLQVYLSASDNSWRRERWLPGFGFRWQIDDRWKLAFMMPQPMVQYRAGETLHLGVGADLRGASYHLNRHFGDDVGRPDLNGSMVDFQEVRVGPNFSWNVKPLIEINGWVGSIVDREFRIHTNDVKLTSHSGPFVMLNVSMLFEVEEFRRFQPGQERIPPTLLNRIFR